MTRRSGPWLRRTCWMKWAKSLKNFVHLSEAGAINGETTDAGSFLFVEKNSVKINRINL